MTARHVALVTGGMGGIGEAIAHALHQAGHRVLVTHSPGNHGAQAWLDRQAALGRCYEAFAMDVADFASCGQAAGAIRQSGHCVDILVNNAGITRDATFRKLSKENWDAVLRTDLDSMFHVTRQFYDGMVEQGWGRIVNIASINGSKGQFGQTNYAAAKAGIHGFTKSLALEAARSGITVNTVSPGYVDTPMLASVPKEVMETRIVPQIPVGRLGRPEEIAALVAFLCGDAAAFMTGGNIAVNGGQHMD